MKALNELLKNSCENAGLSQGDVADKLGYSSPQFVSNWERGLANPPIYILKKLSSMYKISDDDIFQSLLKSNIDRVTRNLQRKFYGKKK